MMVLEVAAVTETGEDRVHNLDSYGMIQTPNALMAVVADGQGEPERGEMASGLAVRTMMETFLEWAQGDPTHGLPRLALQQGHQALEEASLEQPEAPPLRCSASVLVVDGERYHLACAGSTRIYLLRRGALTPLNNPRMLQTDPLRSPHPTRGPTRSSDSAGPAEEPPSPQGTAPGHALLRRLVPADDLNPEEPLHPETADNSRLHVGDVLIICTDGIWRTMEDRVTLGRRLSGMDSTGICEALLRSAREGSRQQGQDNCTALVVSARAAAAPGPDQERLAPE